MFRNLAKPFCIVRERVSYSTEEPPAAVKVTLSAWERALLFVFRILGFRRIYFAVPSPSSKETICYIFVGFRANLESITRRIGSSFSTA